MQTIFFKDDRAYSEWLDAHPAGYILNANTSGPRKSILHKATCRTLFPLRPDRNHTDTYRKVCDDSRVPLERWASEKGHQLADCQICLKES